MTNEEIDMALERSVGAEAVTIPINQWVDILLELKYLKEIKIKLKGV